LPWLLLAIFFAGLLWVNSNPSYVHPDEHLYTDAAVQMVHTGDYWTPYYPDGELRLEKPILTYWGVAGSFRAFGINLFASRFSSALAGLLVVCLTYPLARAMKASRPVAILAMAIIAGNVESLIVATRATPDALLCLFTLVSVWGIARVLFQGDSSCIGPLLAFGGTGLAVQTKALPGFWPLLATGIFWVVAKPGRGVMRKLLRWPAITLGIVFAAFWYGVVFYRHGTAAFRNPYEDQLGSYVTFSPLAVLANVGAYLWGGVQNFLPWVLLLVVIVFAHRTALGAFWRDHRGQMLFGLIPFVLLMAAFSCGNIRGQRYLTPALPPLAVAVAWVLVEVPVGERTWRWVRGLSFLVSGLGILVGAALLLTAIKCCASISPGALAILGMGGAGIAVLRCVDRRLCWIWIAATTATTFIVARACLQPLLVPTALPSLARRLLQQNQQNRVVFTWQVRPSRAGVLYLLTGARFPFQPLRRKGHAPDLSDTQLVVTISPEEALFEQAGYTLAPIEPDNSRCAPVRRLVQQVWPGSSRTDKSARETYWLATRSILPGR